MVDISDEDLKDFLSKIGTKTEKKQDNNTVITTTIQESLKDFHRASKKQRLICHIMNNPNSEITQIKKKLYDQEFNWRKRVYPIDHKSIWFDKKGIGHLHVEVNESDGTIRYLYGQKDNIIENKCENCGGKISYDARNVKDLINRNNIRTFWGIDSSYMTLLLIVGILAVIGIAGLMYEIGENNKTNAILQKYLTEKIDNSVTSPPIAKLIIGVINGY